MLIGTNPVLYSVLTIVFSFLFSFISEQDNFDKELSLIWIAGVNAELYYVRKGIVNNYALSFVLPIHTDVQEILFTWRSLRQGPPDVSIYTPGT